VLRARLPLALMLVLPLAACGKKEPTPMPAPEPPVAAKTESASKAAPVEAPENAAPPADLAAPPADALASGKAEAPAPDRANAKAPPPAAGAGAAGKEIALPKAKDGVLAPGAADKVLPVGAQPIIRLIDAGAEPRSDLSYALNKGGTQKLQMSMDMVMSMRMGAKSLPPTTIPTMSMQLDMAITDKSPSGEWKVDSKLTRVTVSAKGAQQEQMAAAMRPQVEGMKGLGMGYWINGKGHVRDVKLDIPKNFPAAAQQMLQGMNQSFESMVAPLPNEPVGVGARWQVISRMASAGADLLQSATYTLKARDGGKATLEVKLVQLAASDSINAPGMPPGVTTQVKSFSSGGSGTSLLDTKNVAPDTGSMALKTAMDIAVKGSNEGDESSIETQTKVLISKP
jgi:predicted small lipoprotein YifL